MFKWNVNIYYYDTIFARTKSNARFALVKVFQSSLKLGSSQIELIDEDRINILKGDTVSSICIDHLDLDKIESMLDMIRKMDDILCDDQNFDRAIKCKLALKSFESYKLELSVQLYKMIII